MKNQKISEIIHSTNLIQRLINYFKLDDVINELKIPQDISDSIIYKNIFYSIYEILESILVDQFNSMYDQDNYNIKFRENLLSFIMYIENEGYINFLFKDYPVLENILFITIKDIINLINEIYTNYQADKCELNDLFNQNFGSITDIQLEVGDRHNNKSVAKVKFTTGELFYKPKNLLTDQLFNEYLEFMENHNISQFKKVNSLINNNYAWQEVIKCNQYLSIDEAMEYYYRSGIILSIVTCLRGTDIHYENVIVSNIYPTIIDTETILSPTQIENIKIDNGKDLSISVLSTALLPIKDSLYDINVCGLFPKEDVSKSIYYYELIQDNDNGFSYEKKAAKMDIGYNGVYVNNKLVNPNMVKKYLVSGFRDGMLSIYSNKKEFLDILRSEKYENLFIRHILRGTQVYYTFLRESKNPSTLKSEAMYEKLFNILLKTFKPSSFGYLRVEEEIYNLKNLNIPYFGTVLSQKDLISRDKTICKNYFTYSALDNVSHSLSLLDENMIDYQVDLIEMSLFVSEIEHHQLNNSFLYKTISCEEDTIDSFKKFAYKMLNREVITNDIDSSTIYITSFNENELIIDVINCGLYMGGGIVHYLYTYAYVYGDVIIRDFSKRLLNGLYKQISLYADDNKAMFLSVYEGYGGFLYLSYNYFKIFKDKSIYEKFDYVLKKTLNHLSSYEFDNYSDFDYINGLGATINILCKLYLEEEIKSEYKKIIYQIVERYYSNLKKFNYKEVGLAHGISGICLNLSYIYRLLKNNEILDYLIKLLTDEDSLINKNSNLINSSWCRGISGILLARSIIYDNIKNCDNKYISNYFNTLRKDANLSNLIEQILDINSLCLCHGISGNIDSLYFLEKRQFINSSYFDKSNLFNYKYSIDGYQWFIGSDYEFESFMLGKSGVLYSLFHEYYNVPSVCALEFF